MKFILGFVLLITSIQIYASSCEQSCKTRKNSIERGCFKAFQICSMKSPDGYFCGDQNAYCLDGAESEYEACLSNCEMSLLPKEMDECPTARTVLRYHFNEYKTEPACAVTERISYYKWSSSKEMCILDSEEDVKYPIFCRDIKPAI